VLAIDLGGRRAIVTGAGKGIGREICLTLARAGADVFGVSRTVADLDAVGAEVVGHGRRWGQLAVDLRGAVQAAAIVDAAETSFGPVDILVNNAGVAVTGPSVDFSEEDWDTVLDVNTKGAFFLAQAVGRGMLERGRGRIVNVTSQAALGGLTDHAAYCASKAALTLITKCLAVEWGPHGVSCNAVAPTVILTPMGEQVWGDPAKGDPMKAKIPLGRFGVPADVASVVAFLCSDHAAFLNGETISVDGGYSAQ